MAEDRLKLNEEALVELITRVTCEVLRQSRPGTVLPAAGIATGAAGTGAPPGAPAASCDCSGTDLATCVGCGHCVILRPDMSAILQAGADRVSSRPGVGDVGTDLAPLIDHTLLKPDATENDLRQMCEEARRHRFASVCVNSSNVPLIARCLRGSGVCTTAVVGFPLGASSTAAKAAETREAVRHGADEIDMVINIGQLKGRFYREVMQDIEAVAAAAEGRVVKVILETALLSEIEKIAACALAKAAGAHFVKTSTGFGPKGATTEDVRLMREVVGPGIGVKASGGIRDRETAWKMIEAGATRIGASASVAIVSGEGGGARGY